MVEEAKEFSKENPMIGTGQGHKDNVARALESSVIPCWWHDARAGYSSKGRKQAKINKRVVGDSVVDKRIPFRSTLYYSWHGTAAQQSFFDVGLAAGISVVLSVCWAHSVAKSDCTSWDSGCSPRPLWTTHLSSLHHYFKFALLLSGFAVTCRLVYAFRRYRAFYWAARKLQGAITDLALCVGTATSANRISTGFEITFERYLNLLHTLVYLENQNSPQLCDMLRIDDLQRATILGLRLVNNDEFRSLKNAQRSNSCQLTDLVMAWLSASFNKAMYDSLFRVDLGQERALALSVSFQGNMEKVQNAVAVINGLHMYPLPMQLMQYIVHLVDCVSFVFAPAFLTVEVSTAVLEAGRWDKASFMNVVGTTAAAAILVAFVLQGAMRVAQSLESPFGARIGLNAVFRASLAYPIQGSHFLIDIPVILKETRMATFTLFNTRRGIQRPGSLSST